MAFYTHGLLWVVFTPFVLLGLLVVGCVLFSYHYVLRSLDVLLLALLPALFLDILVLVLIQGIVYIQESAWGTVPCLMYTWAWLWLRITELLLLLCLSLERVLFLHAWNYTHRGSWGIKLLAASSWLLAGVIAAIPIIGWDGLDLTVNIPTSCNYMAYEIDHQYAIFMLVFELAIAFLGLGCLGDTLLHLKRFNKDFDKTINGGITRVTSEIQERSNGLMTAYESCKLVCVILLVIFLVNHVPHALMTLYVVLTDEALDAFRLASLWLLLIKGMLLPPCFFIYNTRYKEGLRHFGSALLCRNKYFYEGDKEYHDHYPSASHTSNKKFERKVEGDSMQVLAVPVQQVITRSRMTDNSGKFNPGFESDDEDDEYQVGRRSRMGRDIHQGNFKKSSNNISNASEKSWILVDGFLCRSRPMSESTRAMTSSSLVEIHSTLNSNGSLTDDVTPGTSNSFASTLAPTSARFAYAGSDSSSPEIDTRKKMAMIRAPTPSPRGRNIRVYHNQPALPRTNSCDSDDFVDGGGPQCHRHIVQPLSQAMLKANDELHSRSIQNSPGTPSPDSASHLPYYLKSQSSVSVVSPLTARVSNNAASDTSIEEGSDMGMMSYDDDDIDQGLSSESPQTSSQNMDEPDSELRSLDATSSSSVAASNSIGVSSSQALSLAKDLNIVSYMNVHPETVNDSSSDVNDHSSTEGKYSLSEKDSGTDVEMSRYRTLNDLSQLKLTPPKTAHSGDTGPNEVYLMGSSGVARLDFIGVESSKSQVVRPEPYTDNPQVTLQRSQSQVFEEQVVRTIQIKDKIAPDKNWSMKDQNLTLGKPARRPRQDVPDLTDILADQAHTLPSTKKSFQSAMAEIHEELLKKTKYSQEKVSVSADGYSTNLNTHTSGKSFNGYRYSASKSVSALGKDGDGRSLPGNSAASVVVLDAESLLQQQLKKELNPKITVESHSSVKSESREYRTVVKTIDFENSSDMESPESFERVHLKPPDLSNLTIQVNSEVKGNGLFSDTDYRHMEADLKSRGRGRVIGRYPASPGSDASIHSPGPISPPVSPYSGATRVFAKTLSQH